MNFTHSDILADKNICLGIARSFMGIKSGNARYNAMSASETSDGFVITWSLQKAFYIYFLEEGTRFSQKYKGNIQNMVVPSVAEYLYSKYKTENEVEVSNFKMQAQYGNLDFYKKHEGDFKKSFFGEKTPREMMELRSETLKFSEQQDLNEMSKKFDWQSSERMEVPDKFKKR